MLSPLHQSGTGQYIVHTAAAPSFASVPHWNIYPLEQEAGQQNRGWPEINTVLVKHTVSILHHVYNSYYKTGTKQQRLERSSRVWIDIFFVAADQELKKKAPYPSAGPWGRRSVGFEPWSCWCMLQLVSESLCCSTEPSDLSTRGQMLTGPGAWGRPRKEKELNTKGE